MSHCRQFTLNARCLLHDLRHHHWPKARFHWRGLVRSLLPQR